MKGKIDTRLIKGSKSPGVGYIYVLLFMFLIIASGIVLSGGFVPVDPNGPNGPPTLPPYFDASDYGKQQIIVPSETISGGARQNLQLKTFDVNMCGVDTGVDFLIDISASMNLYDKIGKLKQGLSGFTSQLAGISVIGIQTFGSKVTDNVKMDLYKNNKGEVKTTIDGLKPEGWTRTRDGMEMASTELAGIINQNKFPGYHYALVVITDGVPEIPLPGPRTCEYTTSEPLLQGGVRCFAKEQDPRFPTNIGANIKNLGVNVYTIVLTGPAGSSDARLEGPLTALMQDQASQPSSKYFYKTLNADNITQILNTVVTSICKDVINDQVQGPGMQGVTN
jgi:hypothetical protein